ncbi:MAG: hypothetical protein JNK63_09820 [Chthonomonas sp.]|nr:hypothetical protein [Chthonomonas sp.]
MALEGRLNHLEPDWPFGQAKPGEAVELPESFPATPANLELLKVGYDALKEVDRQLTEEIGQYVRASACSHWVELRSMVRAAILKIEGGDA